METQDQKSKINWKNVLIGIIVGAIMVGITGFGIWYVTRPQETQNSISSTKTSTPSAKRNETANWKTFTSSTDKFSAKYPKEWYSVCSTGHLLVSPVNVSTCGLSDYPSISIYRRNYSFTEEVAFKDDDNARGSFQDFKREELKVAGKHAIKFSGTVLNEFEIDKGTTFQFYVIRDSESSPLIAEYYRKPGKPDYSEIFQEILSSIKFLD